MGQVRHPLRGSLVEHARLRPGLEALVAQAINAAASDLLLQFVCLDLLAQIRAFAGPVGLLDDSAIHVH
jgi:hypothetical protein